MSSVMIEGRTGNGSSARLKAYSSFEPYELSDYKKALADRWPDIALEIERMPTAKLTDRLQEEADTPGADLIIGWADTAAQTDGLAGICIGNGTDGYVRPTGFTTAFITDPKVLSTCGASKITAWADLGQAELANRIIFPDPSISGAGFLAMSTILQFYGDRDGWELLKQICRNVSDFPGSAWKPAEQTGLGQIAVGVTVKIAATKRQSQNNQLTLVEPNDVIGAEAEVYGILKSTKATSAAQKIIDWIVSDSAAEIFTRYNKTLLAEKPENLFMIDSSKAVADRAQNLQRFETLQAEMKAAS